MNQIKFYKFTILALIILNLLIIAFFFFTKPHPHKPPKQGVGPNEFKNEIIDILDLKKDQIKHFDESVLEHNNKMTSIQSEQQHLLKDYFRTLSENEKSIQNDSILELIESNEKNKIIYTYEHFEEVKSMLNEDQIKNFEKFLNRALGMILLDKRGDKPPKQNPNRHPNRHPNHPPKR